MDESLYEKLLGSSDSKCDCSGDSMPRIFRIPEYIRNLSNTPAYTPRVVSLGPLAPSYFNDEQIKITDRVKCGTARHLLLEHRERNGGSPRVLLESCLTRITDNIKDIRDLYKLSTETMENKKLAELMLVDGLFVVHVLLMDKLRPEPTSGNGQGFSRRTGNDAANGCAVHVKEPSSRKGRQRNTAMAPFGKNAWTKKLICYDLLKVENQIPWIVLHHLCRTLFPGIDASTVKRHSLQSLMENMELDVSTKPPEEVTTFHPEPVHLLGLFRHFLVKGCTCGDTRGPNPPGKTNAPNCFWTISCGSNATGTAAGDTNPVLNATNAVQLSGGSNPPGQTNVLNCFWTTACGSNVGKSADPEHSEKNKSVPRAVELERSGIKFRKRKSSKGFLDISFEHGVLEIPPFCTSDYTCTLFRNLIAYEQLRPYGGGGNHITAFIVLVDCLVDTVEDVRLLQRRGIIENRLNSDQAAVDLLNNLKHHGPYTMDGNCLLDVFNDVSKWYENKCNHFMATLEHDYCGHPWMVLGLLAGTLIVGLTILQALYKLLDYYHPRHA